MFLHMFIEFASFYKKFWPFFVAMENIHQHQVGEVLPYQFEPEVGAETSSLKR